MAPNRARICFFLLSQTLPTFWAERIWILRILIWGICWTPHFDFQVPRSPNSQISRSPDFQTPPAPPDEFSDPNLTPLPMNPGIKYVARSPCCDENHNLTSKVVSLQTCFRHQRLSPCKHVHIFGDLNFRNMVRTINRCSSLQTNVIANLLSPRVLLICWVAVIFHMKQKWHPMLST